VIAGFDFRLRLDRDGQDYYPPCYSLREAEARMHQLGPGWFAVIQMSSDGGESWELV
jgi:hypothetical protein